MKRFVVASVVATFLAGSAIAQEPRADQKTFRALYQELVETNTTLSSGSCTLAAERMATRLKTAGYTDKEITFFSVPEHPKEGGLVAVLPGADKSAKAILLLAHIDVVEAKREDWVRDPFKLIEEDGYFYARGAADDKAMAAIFTDTMIRLKGEAKLRRPVKLALTCGEETSGAFNGAEWLAANKRQLIDAAFALNEGGGGRLDAAGKPLLVSLQVAEKLPQDYIIEAHNPGGHSSRPRPDNAIYELAAALTKVGGYRFPTRLTPVTKVYFERTAKLPTTPPALAAAMATIAAKPTDKAAADVLASDPTFDATLRTTCVATLLEGGHAQNALPQSARANINCRIMPGETVEQTTAALVAAIGNPAVTVTPKAERNKPGRPNVLTPALLGPAEKLTAKYYPGLPVIPSMSTGATDSVFMQAVGIPSYGAPGLLGESDGGGTHGLNERIRVESVYKGRDFLHDLIKVYAQSK